MSSGEFADATIVVTGAGQGIGAAISAVLVAAGATVVVSDVNERAAEQTGADLTQLGVGVAHPFGCDVTDEDDVAALAAFAEGLRDGIDGWVNNAGVARDATLRRMSLSDFKSVLEVHLVGGWLGTRAAASHMRDRGRGSIVNISSISGKVGNIGQTNYSAAKAGLVGLTKASAKELGHVGVRVNAVQPGVVKTPMTAGMREDILQARLSEIPLGRFGEPDEVASVVAFLLSDRSSYMTGNVVEIAGGRHM
jgi:3-oxoacyl-[acyl-carrier protein] reductase